MKVLVATAETQGKRKNDFCYVPEGEMVDTGGFECDGESIDGSCGCRRSFCGLKAHKATTTAKVVNVEFAYGVTLEKLVRESLAEAGWVRGENPKRDAKFVREMAESIVHVADAFFPGTVIERRGTKFQERLNGG